MSDVSSESALPDEEGGAAPESHPQWPVPEPIGGFAAPDWEMLEPSPASLPAASFPPPVTAGAQSVQERPPPRMRGPLIGFIAGAVVVALGVGGYLIAHNLLASRDNTPVATSSKARTGGITVTGHGITMTFPAGWVNVPTSPSQFQHFVKEFEAAHGHLPAAIEAEAKDPQFLGSFAMLVFRTTGPGSFAENLSALAGPPGPAPDELLAQLESGQGPSQFGATAVHYSLSKFGNYQGVLLTYTLRSGGMTVYGAQSYLEGPANTVVTTVTSSAAATSDADLMRIVSTIRFT